MAEGKSVVDPSAGIQDTVTGAGATKQVPADQQTKKGDDEGTKFTQDQVNAFLAEEKRKLLEKAKNEAEELQTELDKKALLEKQKYKELYDTAVGDLQKLKGELRAEKILGMRRRVASEVGLPPGLVDRLVGDTEEEIKADAKKLVEMVGKKVESKLVGTPGGEGGTTKPSTNADGKKEIQEVKQKIASRFGYNEML